MSFNNEKTPARSADGQRLILKQHELTGGLLLRMDTAGDLYHVFRYLRLTGAHSQIDREVAPLFTI